MDFEKKMENESGKRNIQIENMHLPSGEKHQMDNIGNLQVSQENLFGHPHSNNAHTSNAISDMTRTKSSKTQPSLDLSRDCGSSHSSQSLNIGKTSVPGPSSHESSPCIESIKTNTIQIQNNEPPLQSKSTHLQNFPPIKNDPENFKKKEGNALIGHKKNEKLKMNIKKMSGDIRTWMTSASIKKKFQSV